MTCSDFAFNLVKPSTAVEFGGTCATTSPSLPTTRTAIGNWIGSLKLLLWSIAMS